MTDKKEIEQTQAAFECMMRSLIEQAERGIKQTESAIRNMRRFILEEDVKEPKE